MTLFDEIQQVYDQIPPFPDPYHSIIPDLVTSLDLEGKS